MGFVLGSRLVDEFWGEVFVKKKNQKKWWNYGFLRGKIFIPSKEFCLPCCHVNHSQNELHSDDDWAFLNYPWEF